MSDATPDLLATIHQWALRLRGGDLAARMQPPADESRSELVEDLNFLAEMLQSLARETEQQLAEHTRHLNQKTQSLSVLYDVAASINMSIDLNDLLSRFLRTLQDMLGVHAASIRFANEDDDRFRLVASIGMTEPAIAQRQTASLHDCLFSRDSEAEFIHVDAATCAEDEFETAPTQLLKTLVVPLRYRERLLGLYTVYVPEDVLARIDGSRELFVGIGQHLAVAIEKARLDHEAQFMSIMEERTNFANELHDSLAQTILSIGYQLRVLDETLRQSDQQAVWKQMRHLKRTLDDANTEARDLISHFRTSVGRQGLIPSIKQTVQRFRSDTGIQIFLQEEWQPGQLPTHYEVHILRIVQEALNNVRKHSQANTVRVLLSSPGDTSYRVLIEDDGIGMSEEAQQHPGKDHFGLAILRDRAERLGADLAIDSEPGEGTSVTLRFTYTPALTESGVHIDLSDIDYAMARTE